MAFQVQALIHMLTPVSTAPVLYFFLTYTDKPEDGAIIVDISEISQDYSFLSQDTTKNSEHRQPDDPVQISGSSSRYVQRDISV